MLKMLSSVPGYYSVGNFKGKIERYTGIEPGEVVHGHDPYSPVLGEILSENQVKVILMNRDPRDQAVSRIFHHRRDISSKFHSLLISLDDDAALMTCIEGAPGFRSVLEMSALTRSWLDSKFPLLCVRYEELLMNPKSELDKVLQFLNIHMDAAFVRSNVSRNRFERLTLGKKIWKSARRPGQADPNSHFRKGISGDWRNYFKEDHKRRFKEIAGETLIELGYEQDLNW